MMLSLKSIALVLMVSNVVIWADVQFPGRPQTDINWPPVPKPGPIVPKPGPSVPKPDPIVPNPGPNVPKPDPSGPKPDPIVPKPGPSGPKPGPNVPNPGPIVPKPDPIVPKPGPIVPKPLPSVPDPAPSVPKPGPSAPNPGPSPPDPVPSAPNPAPSAPNPGPSGPNPAPPGEPNPGPSAPNPATSAPVVPGGVTEASSETSADKPGKIFTKKVKDALEKAGKAAKILRDMKLDKRGIITALSELSFLVPQLVPIGLLFSAYLRFVPGDEKIDPVQKALSTLNSQLYGIDYKLDDLADKIEDTQIKAAFKSHLAKIMNLEHFLNRTLDVSNSLTKNDFRKACSHSNMLEFINYIRDELSTQQYLPLGKLMINGYDLAKFNNWATTLTRSVIRANFMHINCMSVREVPEQELNDTLKVDLAYIADVTAQMKTFVEENSDNIVNKYYVQAKQEIEQYHKSHQDESDKQFTKNLYQKMHDKYFWRDWIVLSYPVKLVNYRGENNYAFAPDNDHVYSKLGQFGRSLYVASTNNHAKWGELNLEVDNCVAKYNRHDWYEHKLSSHWWGYKIGGMAAVVLADLKQCFPKHNGLAVVRYADSRDVNNEDADPKKWSYTGVEYAHNGDTTGLVLKIVRSQGREKFEMSDGYWGYKRWTLVYVAPELGLKQTGGQTPVSMIQWLNKPIVQPQITISSLFGNRELNGTDLADLKPVNGTDLADLELVNGTAKFNPLEFISYDAYRYNATDLITN